MSFELLVLQFGLAGFYLIAIGSALCVLRTFAFKRLSFSDYVVALWNFVAFLMHSTVDTYFLYSERLPQSRPILNDGQLPAFSQMVEMAWHEYGKSDLRMYKNEYQPLVLTTTLGASFISLPLCFVVFVGYLLNWHRAILPLQVTAAVAHIALVHNFVVQELLEDRRNLTSNPYGFYAFNLPFVIIPLFAIFHSFQKLK